MNFLYIHLQIYIFVVHLVGSVTWAIAIT